MVTLDDRGWDPTLGEFGIDGVDGETGTGERFPCAGNTRGLGKAGGSEVIFYRWRRTKDEFCPNTASCHLMDTSATWDMVNIL